MKKWLMCLVCSGGDDDMRRLIPLPQEISAGCGLAWRMLPGEYEQEKDRIEKSGIVIESNIIIMI